MILAAAGALLAGLLAGWWLGRRHAAPVPRGPTPVPPVALEWLRRLHDASALWLRRSETDVTRVGRADAGVEAVVRARLAAAAAGVVPTPERLGGGTLVCAGHQGLAAALLAPERSDLDSARRDLDTLIARTGLLEVPTPPAPSGPLTESVESVALRLAHQVERECGVACAVVARDGTRLRVVATSARADRRLLGALVPPLSAVGEAIRTGQASGPDATPLAEPTGDRRRGGQAARILPLGPPTGAVGALVVWIEGSAASSPALDAFLARLAEPAGHRLTLAVEAASLRAQAERDPLTGLANRRAFEGELRRVGRDAGALILCDLDRFKALNDTLGHAAGDAALVHLARLLEREVRDGDVVGRVGGEEFAVWLPGAGLDVGFDVAERIRAALARSGFAYAGSPWPLTGSFGVAHAPTHARHPDLLPPLADAAMYDAKRSGRDRVRLASPANLAER